MQERENGRARLQQLEDEQRKVREEQQQHQEQLGKILDPVSRRHEKSREAATKQDSG